MSQARVSLAEVFKPFAIIPPQNINGGAKNSLPVSLKFADHVSVLLTVGVQAAASTIKVQTCDDNAGNNATDIAFHYYKSATNTDVMGARQAATSAGVATDGATANVMYQIEFDTAEILANSATQQYVRVTLSTPGANDFYVCAVAVPTNVRYPGDPQNQPSVQA